MDHNDDVLKNALAQQIYREEEIRIAHDDLSDLAVIQQDETELHGNPLTHK